MPNQDTALFFKFFNEIAIIEQLSRALFDARLPLGFITPQFAVLNHLLRVKDGRTPLELARAFQTPKNTMTHTLTILQKAGLVEMRQNPQDGRSKHVFITPEGRIFRDEAIAVITPELTKLKAALNANEIQEILPKLEKLRIFMDINRA